MHAHDMTLGLPWTIKVRGLEDDQTFQAFVQTGGTDLPFGNNGAPRQGGTTAIAPPASRVTATRTKVNTRSVDRPTQVQASTNRVILRQWCACKHTNHNNTMPVVIALGTIYPCHSRKVEASHQQTLYLVFLLRTKPKKIANKDAWNLCRD